MLVNEVKRCVILWLPFFPFLFVRAIDTEYVYRDASTSRERPDEEPLSARFVRYSPLSTSAAAEVT